MDRFTVCPYFKGVVEEKRKHLIKCGERFLLSYEKECDRDNMMINICQGDMESCRPFLYRRLEEMGLSPQSYWSTERLKETYTAINEAIEYSDNDVFDYIESLL